MTGTVNSIGTQLSGKRSLSEEEIKKWEEFLPYSPNVKLHDYKICTKAFVIFFLPLIPLETIVYYDLPRKFYKICYYPAGEKKVYWEHIREEPMFYIGPIIIFLIIIYLFKEKLHL